MNTAYHFSSLSPAQVAANDTFVPPGTGDGSALAGVAATEPDARVSLLVAVDFKWLMAGQGWWIDTSRIHCDPSYASALIRFALASHSFALRECAALLQPRMGGMTACDSGRLAAE